MFLLQLPQDLINWFLEYFLNILLSYFFGIVTTIIYLLIRPRTSFWFAKQKVKLLKKGMELSLDALIVVTFLEEESDNLLGELAEHLSSFSDLKAETIKTDEGESLRVTVSLPSRNLEFEGRFSIDVDTGQLYALKLKSEDLVTYGNLRDYVDCVFTARDLIHEGIAQSAVKPDRIPRTTLGVASRTKQLKAFQWLAEEHEIHGLINIRETDIQLVQSPRQVSVSTVAFRGRVKEIVENLAVETTLS